ncbi:UV damage endonuclease UvdE [Cryptococcus gattii E566]|uniref:UV-damage endonuclease (UVDE), putative n=2 Tax=Cryptococcus gattii TaxID=37769 RepID=E6R945_CRYGW|nr:UV-damage endonuclease (UVDE), putative [Cryptococcus gattii WM276]ADV23342.1 UV-damage endonuclease (UVDE), putative [Cryptococcus gattii WM276]KIR77915.1 UV damage endonuclease UvdE [Cryptococcus gattii EJB2]KIY31998.1 UV damage endonuclease UvdE [Cryptococcus gattii E566]KJE03264.1 UV damage endonuclease UvdE [Cryptococcus gattii NT-10]
MLLPLLRPPRLSTIITRVVLRRQYSTCLSELFPRSFHIHASMPPRRSTRTALQPSSTNLAPLAAPPKNLRNLEQMPAPFPPSKPPRETLLAVALSMDEDNLTPPPASDVEDEQVGKALNGAADRLVLTKRKRSSKLIVEEEGMENGDASSTKGKKRGRKTRDELSAAKKEEEREEELDVKERLTTPDKGKKSGRKIKVESAVTAENAEQEKKPKKKVVKKSRIAKDEPQYDEEGNEIVTRNRKPRVYPKKHYEIPDVERKTTTFRDLKTLIQWNEDNKIRFMRMSSEMFPFASHAKYGYSLDFAEAELKEAGELAKKYGHRLTMHPGQFTQLGSPKKAVVNASIRELEYHCEIMDRMGLGPDGVMIIHMGGVYGDKESTLARFKENYTTLASDKVKARLVLENDEICYNVDDLLPVCTELDIPIIFDYHHDALNPSPSPPSELIPRIAEVWNKKGIKMKQHLSEPRPGAESIMERRAHADRCQTLPAELPDNVDLMIEAKDKEQAVFELYRIYGLEDVVHDNLRPPDPNPGMQTKGRKSNLKKKTTETGGVDSLGEPIQLSDIEKKGDGGAGDEGVKKGGEVAEAVDDAAMEIDGEATKEMP